jgi:hypothetical protein
MTVRCVLCRQASTTSTSTRTLTSTPPVSLLLPALQTNLHSQVALGLPYSLRCCIRRRHAQARRLSCPRVTPASILTVRSQGQPERLAGWFATASASTRRGPRAALLLMRSPALLSPGMRYIVQANWRIVTLATCQIFRRMVSFDSSC